MRIKIDSASIANTKGINKPNEDYYLYNEDKGLVILLDGVSRDKENGVYPNPSPALEVSKILAGYCMNRAEEMLSEKMVLSSNDLKRILSDGNVKILDYNKRLDHDFPAGTVGIFVYFHDHVMEYAYIGDCFGKYLHDQNETQFTEIQTKEVAAHKKELTTVQIRKEICNNYLHPYGYGVLDGNPGATDFIMTGSIRLLDRDTVFLYSDGAAFSVNMYGLNKASSMNAGDILCYTDKTGNAVSGLDDQTLSIIRL